MSTKIEWADETINPIVGCSKISPACENCYLRDITRQGLYDWERSGAEVREIRMETAR